MTWTQGADDLGAHVTFTAMAPAGYSGMLVDNISMVGLPPEPLVPSPIPEPETYALMLAGLGAIGWVARRRRR